MVKKTRTHNLLATSTCILRGRRGTYTLGWLWWRAWFPVDAVVAAAVCVAGVALGDIDLHFAWQAWHVATSTCILRGRRGTYGTGLAPVARLGDIDLHFAWQAWHVATSTCILRGRRGAYGTGLAPVARLGDIDVWRYRPSLCVAGVALGNIDVHSAWQAWHLHPGLALVARLVPSGRRCRRGCLRGRRGTWRHRPPLCVAGVARGNIDVHSAWQAWHLYWAGSGGALGRHRPPLCVAGVARGDIDVHSAWQAWRLRHWAGSGGALGRQRRALCAAGVALGDIDVHFVWQAWHLRPWAGSCPELKYIILYIL